MSIMHEFQVKECEKKTEIRVDLTERSSLKIK